ncbi:hypothetical protein [Nocardia sp. NBC_00403]|uniref:hypothetical protein n=1 Tax=Nocardia sp. NBC_00403 TaxID=2975990 RepID=UPI002E20BB55
MTIEHPIEDEVTQLARRVEKARGRLAYQFDPALTEALSEDELLAERQLAEKIRDQDRGQRWKHVQAAAAAADRARHTTEAIEKADIRDLLVARKAIAAQRRESSPHAKLASLYRHRSWSLRALAGVVAAGMLWSAVNVQQNIAPSGPSDPLYWFSYLIESMISVCLIIIMIGTNKVAEWGILDNRRQVAAAEIALLALTITLNTYPYVRDGKWYDAAVHAVAPVMIGVALLIHDAASTRYGHAIAQATEQVRELPDPADLIRHRLPTVASYRASARADTPTSVAALAAAEQHDEPEPRPRATEAFVDQSFEVIMPEDDEVAPSAFVMDIDTMVDPDERPASSVATVKTAARRAPSTSGRTVSGSSDNDESSNDRLTAPMATKESATSSITKTRPTVASNGKRPSTEKPAAATKVDSKPVATVSSSSTKVKASSATAGKPTVPASAKTAAKADTKSESASTAIVRQTPAVSKSDSAATDADSDVARPQEIYDTGQFRVAEILEQELAELQAERRRARTSRQR